MDCPVNQPQSHGFDVTGNNWWLSVLEFFLFWHAINRTTLHEHPANQTRHSSGVVLFCRVQWLRGRALDSRLWEPGFKSCAAVLKPWATYFTLHCSSSLSCINEYLAIDSGGCVYEQPSHINYSIWLDASQRSRDGVWVNRSVREVKLKCFELSWGLDTALHKNLALLFYSNWKKRTKLFVILFLL